MKSNRWVTLRDGIVGAMLLVALVLVGLVFSELAKRLMGHGLRAFSALAVRSELAPAALAVGAAILFMVLPLAIVALAYSLIDLRIRDDSLQRVARFAFVAAAVSALGGRGEIAAALPREAARSFSGLMQLLSGSALAWLGLVLLYRFAKWSTQGGPNAPESRDAPS